ncbi:hypothetical protein GCM10009846_20580 [Agrococcus versicolor]|uniref:Uncharacterized protein n=1 Tax=Agrococcus versicolor TaxID=501482 RepID=A0ABP5MLP6_9MICO
MRLAREVLQRLAGAAAGDERAERARRIVGEDVAARRAHAEVAERRAEHVRGEELGVRADDVDAGEGVAGSDEGRSQIWHPGTVPCRGAHPISRWGANG